MKDYQYDSSMKQRLFELRKALGLTQKQIGHAIGMSRAHYGNLERDPGSRIPESVIVSLCSVFSANYDYLVNGKGPMINEKSARQKALEKAFNQLSEPFQDCLLKIVADMRQLQDTTGPKQ